MLKSLLLVSACIAWGDKAHRMVGLIAQNFLTPTASSELAKLLPEYKGQLDNATVWADEIKFSDKSFSWAYPLHFVRDSTSMPLENCGYEVERDCNDGFCISGAIANFTKQATCNSGFKDADRAIAVKFLAHFCGDTTMPLHILGTRVI